MFIIVEGLLFIREEDFLLISKRRVCNLLEIWERRG